MGILSETVLGEPPITDGTEVRSNRNPSARAIMSQQPGSANQVPMSTQFASSLPRSIQGQIVVYARSLFPEMELKDAMDRFGVQNGEIVYVDRNNKLQYADPPYGQGINAVEYGTRKFARNAGDIGVTAAGIAGTAIPGAGPVAGPAVAGMGAEALRQVGAGAVSDESFNPAAVALEGASALIPAAGSRALTAVRNRKRFADDVANMDRAEYDRLLEGAERFNIPLTDAEASGLGSLIARQKVLLSYPGANDKLVNFYQIRNDQVRNALNEQFNAIGKESSPMVAQANFVRAARRAIEKEKNDLRIKARPFYKISDAATGIDTKGTLAQINAMIDGAKGADTEILKDVRKLLLRGDGQYDDTGLGLDAAVKQIQAKMNALDKPQSDTMKAASPDLKGKLDDIKNRLVEDIAVVAPEYKKARSIYAEGAPDISKLEKSLVGLIAKIDPDDSRKLTGVHRTLFSPTSSSPEAVAQAREAFIGQGMRNQWNDLIRAHMTETIESLPSVVNGNQVNLGSAFRRALVGTGKKQSMLNEALKHNPEIAKNFMWLTDVLMATGRANTKESITAFAQMGQQELAREGGGVLPGIIETAEVWRSPSRLAAYMKAINTDKYASNLADLLTSKNGIQNIKKLRKMSPRSIGAQVALSHILIQGGLAGAEESVMEPADRAPAVMGQGPQR